MFPLNLVRRWLCQMNKTQQMPLFYDCGGLEKTSAEFILQWRHISSWSTRVLCSERLTVDEARGGLGFPQSPEGCSASSRAISSREGTQSTTDRPLVLLDLWNSISPTKYLKDPFLKQDSNRPPRGPSPVKRVLLQIPVRQELLSSHYRIYM